ncbi:MAG TPA: anthranilate phosphoribosyltransferase [Terriglobales bacterium]|nr:anthranilate phosphoribosyltransferase [Terriglobales bacterium]
MAAPSLKDTELLPEILQRLLRREDLSRTEARALLEVMFAGGDGERHDLQVTAVLTALAAKGETEEEITGFAEGMRAAMADIGLRDATRAWVDTCGTGGTGRAVFNVSTAAALTVAGAGVGVAKHGNRSSTSVCGSADVLEAAGVNLQFPVARLGACLEEVGMAFLFAPLLHPAMARVMPVRRALRVRTIFNLLGPLTNPAGAQAQVVGVGDAGLAPKLAAALARLGTRHSFVVRSRDGLGELSTTDVNEVAEIRDGEVRQYALDARELGLKRVGLNAFACRSKTEAVTRLHQVLAGEAGPLQDIVSLNAGAALLASGQAQDWTEGLAMARASLQSGAARRTLENLVAYTQG